ncbi:MAG: nucleoid occlusion factor SlmA [Burkholderiaceae bacterium]|jgi:TetR/AcrR family transcriptional regulator|nr:nucleoid occlusion factor SlmA [Oxalobacteraceae bacterium]
MPNSKTGERKLQILQALAGMLESPKAEKVTTAALAAKLDVSEAALYRHFASKAQMYEGLIEFIETSIFTLVNKITQSEENGRRQALAVARMLLDFSEQNPGMTKVMMGDALVNEDERLQRRMNQFVDRVELALRQSWKLAATQGGPSDDEAAARAALLMAFVIGRWHRFVKSGFQLKPTDGALVQLGLLVG